MRTTKKSASLPAKNDSNKWRSALWLVLFGGTLFLWPTCLDRYLAPRFFFLSLALLIAFFWLWTPLRQQKRGAIFDWLFLGWYALNLGSVFWALSWSEGVFYAQKALLLLAVYWLIRQALSQDETMVRKTLRQITLGLSGVVCLILLVQLGMALADHGLDNETLYDYASGVFGNKSLAAEFLFFLLVLNALFVLPENANWTRKPLIISLVFGTLFLLILVLQVRTALLATFIGALIYCSFRAAVEPVFRKQLLLKLLPAGMLALGLFFALLSWRGSANSVLYRLNPLNYGESDTANERRFIWHKTDLLNADHYWLGVGNGSWKFWMPSKSIRGGYRLEEKNIVFTRAHNDYLEIRAEMGILGVGWFCALFGIAFLGVIFYLYKSFSTGAKDEKNDRKAGLEVLTLGVGLMGYCLIQYFDFPRERIEFQVVLALLFAFLAHKFDELGLNWGTKFTPTSQHLLMFCLIPGLIFNLVIGLQRMRGEMHNVRLMEAQSSGNWRKVVAETQLAENTFYEYTDSAIPLAWHEGVAWFQLGQFDKADKAFAKAYQLNPWSFQVINNYASTLVKLNRYPEAIPLFEKALEINPRYDDAKFNLSYVYYLMSDSIRASDWLNRVDTIPGPANEEDRVKNRTTLQQLEKFRKVLREKHQ